MANLVANPKWAGAFDCASCKRKRLIAAEFSKAMITRHQSDHSLLLKCKMCAAEEAEKERLKREDDIGGGDGGGDGSAATSFLCASCKANLPEDSFNKNQLKKGAKARCRKCVESAEAEAVVDSSNSQKQALSDLREKAKTAEASGNALEKVATMSALAAAEAEVSVTYFFF
jgi:hypothetical protein